MRKLTFVAVMAAAIAAAGFTALPAGASSGSGAASAGDNAPVCLPSAAQGVAHCGAVQLLNPAANWHGAHAAGRPVSGTTTTPSGYNPSDIQSAYGLGSAITNFTPGSQTVAVVDAYHDPNAAGDLAAYRSSFNLPACGSGCFTQVAQDGSKNFPGTSTSWSEEISLDLDMVSAVCPGCHILLVEASSSSLADLATAENYAAAHANVVSNSYGAREFSGETSYDGSYNHPGVVITVSAGDSGYGVEYPAASRYVTAVGGTSLTRSSATRGWSESVWSGTGSGCSAYEANPGWQPSTAQCKTRTVADTSADANPNTGVAVYDSFGEPGWLVFGGTSVASPILASVYALAGNAATTTAHSLYGASLNRVTSGTNARRCTTYLCNAADSLQPSGYNGPTGNGTPIGTNGF
jgi:subtilase family serine protease